jgi:predicted GIY-YIG superfamily endonuclease
MVIAGLVPAIQSSNHRPMAGNFYVYIPASTRNGTLYIGVTNDIVRMVIRGRAGGRSTRSQKTIPHGATYTRKSRSLSSVTLDRRNKSGDDQKGETS